MTSAHRFVAPPGADGSTAHADSVAARPRVTRRERTRANDEAILDAAVERIRVAGVDALSMREVADRAGLTSGATYARYENAIELAIDVWTRRCQGPVMGLIADSLTLLFRPEPARMASVARRLTKPDAVLRAGIELLAVSRRVSARFTSTCGRSWFREKRTWRSASAAPSTS